MFLSEAYYVVLKLTEQCNLRCSYCYVPDKDQATELMNMDIFKTFCEKLAAESRYDWIRLLYHGGEPLLWGKENFIESAGIVDWLEKKHHKKLYKVIQSNGTLIDEEWVELFKKYDFHIGVSLDGPPSIHNLVRQRAEDTVRGIRLMQSAGQRVGILTVVGRHNIDRINEVMDYFVNELGITSIKIHDVQALSYNNSDNLAINVDEFLDMLVKVYQQYTLKGIANEANTYNDIKKYLDFKRKGIVSQSICHSPWCQAGSSIIGLKLDGTLLPCGRWYGVPDVELGNIRDSDSHLVLKRMEFVKRYLLLKDETWEKCKNCQKAPICRFNCTAWQYMTTGSNGVEEMSCKRAQRFWELFEQDQAKLNQLFDSKKVRNRIINNKAIGQNKEDC